MRFTKFIRLTTFLLFVLCNLSACGPRFSGKQQPQVQNGVLDLRSWNFENDGPSKTQGEWEFYWQQLFTSKPTDLDPTGFIQVPGIWNGYSIDNQEISGNGYATYRLQVLLDENLSGTSHKPPKSTSTIFYDHLNTELGQQGCQALGFKFRFQQTAFSLFVNGKLVTSAGKVGITKEEAQPEYRPHVAQFIVCQSKLDIVVQVSNFHHQKGGLESDIIIGKGHQLITEWENRQNFDLFLLGAILIMGLYHLGLFALRHQNRAPLYFGLFCILISIRSIAVGQYFIFNIFPSIPWEAVIRIEYLGFYLPYPFMALFVNSLFPDDFPDWLLKAVILITGIFTVTTIIPPIYFTHILLPYQVFLVVASVGMSLVVVKAAYEGRKGAKVFLLGMAALLITLLNDILYNQRIISSSMLFPFGLFIFIFAQSFLLSLLFSRTFSDVEVLSEKLEIRNQRLQELDRLKDEFITNTSHELRTPLTGIIGIAESLLEGATGKISPETERNLKLIVTSGKRLANLVNDIIDFSRLKHSDIALVQKVINPKPLVDLVLNLSTILVGQKEITLKNHITADIPNVYADENRLQQIIINLVDNAIKFTQKGEILIKAQTEDDFVVISVSDTGIGIPYDRQKTIFESFEQGDGSIAREYGGSGLGLAVTKRLIELHGGTISLVSEEGRGSTFSFSLPVAKDQSVSETNSSFLLSEKLPQPISKVKEFVGEDILEKSIKIAEGPKILVVDDELINIQVINNQLSMHNYGVISAMDGFQGLQKLEKEKPDLIVLDLMLPRMSGYEFCVKVRESYSAAELPIIILTAKNQVGDLVKGLSCGANDYIAKPFAKEELLSRIENQLKLQQYAQELIRLNLNLEVINQSLEKRVSKRTHELSYRNDKMKQFLHILCHDLLNPFANLKSIMEIIKNDPDQFDSLSESINTSINNGIAIISMVKKMRDLEKEKIAREMQQHPLYEMIQESEQILAQKLKEKNLSLQVSIDSQLNVLVERTSFINSVLNNLLSNAIKFSYPGSAIKISSSYVGKGVLVTIRDFGIGMPDSIIENLYNLDKPTSRKGTNGEKGTGYGMPLVKRFINAYGGSISVNSYQTDTQDEEKGTEICLTLNRD